MRNTLEERILQARGVLQRTSENHPAFEHRVQTLVALVSLRDLAGQTERRPARMRRRAVESSSFLPPAA